MQYLELGDVRLSRSLVMERDPEMVEMLGINLPVLLTLAGAVFFVLLIACANLMSLLLAAPATSALVAAQDDAAPRYDGVQVTVAGPAGRQDATVHGEDDDQQESQPEDRDRDPDHCEGHAGVVDPGVPPRRRPPGR